MSHCGHDSPFLWEVSTVQFVREIELFASHTAKTTIGSVQRALLLGRSGEEASEKGDNGPHLLSLIQSALASSASLFQDLHNRAGDWISDAAPVAKVLKRVAKRVERCNHAWPSAGYRVHVGPLGDDAESMLASRDNICVLESRPFNLVMSVEKLLSATWLNLETDGIEGSHYLLLTCCCDQIARKRRRMKETQK
jgi:hypothetical protein